MRRARRARIATAATMLLLGLLALGLPSLAQTAAEDTVAAAETPAAATTAPRVHLVPYDGPITPVAAEFLGDRLAEAADADVDAVVIQLDTPGGLDVAMRDIIKAMLASPVPVIVHVAPPGARAASAGRVHHRGRPRRRHGARHQHRLGQPGADGRRHRRQTMAAKVANDAAAYIASFARQRGRNEDLARRFVTEAINLTANEAREAGLIDVLAPTTATLLDSLDGRDGQVQTRGTRPGHRRRRRRGTPHGRCAAACSCGSWTPTWPTSSCSSASTGCSSS